MHVASTAQELNHTMTDREKQEIQDATFLYELKLRQLDYDVRDHRHDEQPYRYHCDAHWIDDDYRHKRAHITHEIERLKKLLKE